MEAPTRTQTEPGKVMGTVDYMSPEQVRGQEADHRSDIFAVGMILYEMLAGRRAFQGQSAVEAMNAILKEEPPDLLEINDKISPGLARVVNHCLEKNPALKYLFEQADFEKVDYVFGGSIRGSNRPFNVTKAEQRGICSWASGEALPQRSPGCQAAVRPPRRSATR